MFWKDYQNPAGKDAVTDCILYNADVGAILFVSHTGTLIALWTSNLNFKFLCSYL